MGPAPACPAPGVDSNSPRRFVCLVEADERPLQAVRRLSSRWFNLAFLLDYEVESERMKGLAKAQGGRLEHWETGY